MMMESSISTTSSTIITTPQQQQEIITMATANEEINNNNVNNNGSHHPYHFSNHSLTNYLSSPQSTSTYTFTPFSSSSSLSDISNISNCSEMSMGTISNGELGGIIMDFSSRDLTKLPSKLPCEKDRIESFQSTNNQITTIPDDYFFHFNSLTTLNLDNNKIKKLPKSLKKLNNLSNVKLSRNKIKKFPNVLLTLNNIQCLDLSDNKISGIPKDINKMTGLKELYITNNQIDIIPVQVAELTLFIFEIYGNPIILPPPDIIDQGIEGIFDYLIDETNQIHFQKHQNNTLEQPVPVVQPQPSSKELQQPNNNNNNMKMKHKSMPPISIKSSDSNNSNSNNNNSNNSPINYTMERKLSVGNGSPYILPNTNGMLRKTDSSFLTPNMNINGMVIGSANRSIPVRADSKLFSSSGDSMVIQASPTAITNTYYTPKRIKPKLYKKPSKECLQDIQNNLLHVPEVTSTQSSSSGSGSGSPSDDEQTSDPSKWVTSSSTITFIQSTQQAERDASKTTSFMNKRDQRNSQKILDKEIKKIRKEEEKREKREKKLNSKKVAMMEPNKKQFEKQLDQELEMELELEQKPMIEDENVKEEEEVKQQIEEQQQQADDTYSTNYCTVSSEIVTTSESVDTIASFVSSSTLSDSSSMINTPFTTLTQSSGYSVRRRPSINQDLYQHPNHVSSSSSASTTSSLSSPQQQSCSSSNESMDSVLNESPPQPSMSSDMSSSNNVTPINPLTVSTSSISSINSNTNTNTITATTTTQQVRVSRLQKMATVLNLNISKPFVSRSKDGSKSPANSVSPRITPTTTTAAALSPPLSSSPSSSSSFINSANTTPKSPPCTPTSSTIATTTTTTTTTDDNNLSWKTTSTRNSHSYSNGAGSLRERRGTIASEMDLKYINKSSSISTSVSYYGGGSFIGQHASTTNTTGSSSNNSTGGRSSPSGSISFPPLIEVLHDDYSKECFRSFLKSEFSNENLDFWSRIETYKQLESKDKKVKDSIKIYNLFISDKSLTQVNLPSNCVKKLDDTFNHQNVNNNDIKENIQMIDKLFLESQSLIFKLMESDSYERFKRSSHSKIWLK